MPSSFIIIRLVVAVAAAAMVAAPLLARNIQAVSGRAVAPATVMDLLQHLGAEINKDLKDNIAFGHGLNGASTGAFASDNNTRTKGGRHLQNLQECADMKQLCTKGDVSSCVQHADSNCEQDAKVKDAVNLDDDDLAVRGEERRRRRRRRGRGKGEKDKERRKDEKGRERDERSP